MERLLIEVHGTVQGVGFRPYVYSRATALGLRGFAQNRGGHLFIDLEGDAQAVRSFVHELSSNPPPRAVIEGVTCRTAPPAFKAGFSIITSEPVRDDVRIPPDLATCDDCVRELFDPADRRYRYPFISCAHCGPRFTIVTGVPYDRARTTMREFPMCPACRREYEDPSDRRFHAQPIACAACGPTLALYGRTGPVSRGHDAVEGAAAALASGRIVAVKGLGGYHLACDAASEGAVADLRRRKQRDAKPFAVMVSAGLAGDLMAEPAIRALLEAPERPIVLIDRRLVPVPLAEAIAPGCPAIGVLLPYTPIHHLLMRALARPLVMTSGNINDEPIAFEDDDARARLADTADLLLVHDRRIHVRCDDSVVRATRRGCTPVRRSRGFAPAPLKLVEQAPQPVLATGGHLKNTFCIHAGDSAWLSSHVGDLESAAAYASLRAGVEQAIAALGIRPSIVAHDRHPDYLSTRFAAEYPAVRRIPVQHHLAHVLSCAAEHGIAGPVLGVAFDGSGMGDDGTVWGGEFLLVDGVECTRVAHLACVPLAGGEAAVRQPWRMAVAHLTASGDQRLLDHLAERIGPPRLAPVLQMVSRRINAPLTSSVGRLFDAVAAIAGVRDEAAFEGQAAMELEALASGDAGRRYAFEVHRGGEPWLIDAAPVIRGIAADVLRGIDRASVAAGFHAALAHMVGEVASTLARRCGTRHVALTGGVFQNARLLHDTVGALEASGMTPLVHRRVPCNDGGLALGQSVAAVRVLQREGATGGRPCV